MKRTSINRIMALVFALTVPGLSLADFSRGASEGVRADLTGTLSVIHIDHLDERQGKNIYILEDKLSKRRYKIKFEVEPTANYTNGSTVRVKGRVQGDELVLEANGSGSIETLEVAYAISSGHQSTLVMVADFKDRSVPCLDSDIQKLMFTDPSNPNDTSLNAFYQKNSLGQVSFSGDVAGRYEINYSSSSCDYNAWASALDAEAKRDGYDPSSYRRKVYVMPKNGCGAAGIGTVGGSPSKAWVFHCQKPALYAHEIGHNLSFEHASDLTAEYGDNTDVMGLTNGYTHFNAPHKEQAGWMPSSQIEPVNQSGLYYIAPLEADPAQTSVPQIIKIAKPDSSDYYYFSFRRNIDSFSTLSSTVRERLSVHQYKGDGSVSKTYLHGTFGDGETFTDSSNGITVTQISHTAEYTTIDIQLNSSCIASIPSISITPGSQTASAGTTLDYTVSVSNQDGRKCSQSTFDLYSTLPLPSGWSATVSPNSLTLMPGNTGTATLSITSAGAAADAEYEFNVEAFDSYELLHTAEVLGSYIVSTDNDAPTAPILLVSANRKGASLSWSGATDDVGVVSYAIWRDESLLTTTNSSSYSDKNVSANANYDYTVTARDGSENQSPASNLVNVTISNGGGSRGKNK